MKRTNDQFPESAFDTAVEELDIEILGQLIESSIVNDHLYELRDYVEVRRRPLLKRAILQLALLSAFKMESLRGLDLDPYDFLSEIQLLESNDVLDGARELIKSELQRQIAQRNTYFLSIDSICKSEAAIFVKSIIEARRTEFQELCKCNPTMDEIAATYYGFQLMTSQVRKSSLCKNFETLFNSIGLDYVQDTRLISDNVNPDRVVFGNVSAYTDELLRNILFLTQDNSDRRAVAAARLGEMGDPRAEPYLIHALDDEYSWVRKSAVSALGRIRIIENPTSVVAVLKDSDESTRKAAMESVIALGLVAVPHLIDILSSYQGYSYSDALELAKRSHPRALDSLDALLQYNSRMTRTLAAEALGRIGDPSSIPALEKALCDTDSEVQLAAERALMQIRGFSS